MSKQANLFRKHDQNALGAAALTAALAAFLTAAPALAQRDVGGGEGGGDGPSRPPGRPFVPPVYVPAPPPPPTPPPPSTSPVTPGPSVRMPTPPIMVPTDVEKTMPSFPGNAPGLADRDISSAALHGIILLQNKEFPKESAYAGPTDGITVKWKEDSEFKKVNDYIVKFDDGEILVSCKKPSKMALIETPIGKVNVQSNGDVLASMHKGVLRVTNLDGTGKTIKAKFENEAFTHGKDDLTVAIAPGYELVVSEKRLTRPEIRPADGLARRHFKVVAHGHMAISEISLDRIMQVNDLVAELRQTSGAHERRIMGDLSKMAAVLNYRNGTQGFSVEGARVATQTKEGETVTPQ